MTRLRVYLSAASRDYDRASYWASAIRSCSELSLVSTWLASAKSWAGQDARLPLSDQRNVAQVDLREVYACDVCWLLMPTVATVGAFVELGFAIAHSKRIVISGPNADSSIFTALASHRSADDSLAFGELLRLAASQTQPMAVQAQASVRPGGAL